jgi:1,4-dihydroxy-2-naphthoyl-CoA synthase
MMVWLDNKFAGEATRLAYMTEEAKEVEMLFLRKPNFERNGCHKISIY